jgi:hypothetical protein
MSGFEYEQNSTNLFNPHSKNVEVENCQSIYFEAIEFPWVFHGRSAVQFIQYLNEQAYSGNSRLFSNKIIQQIILYQWRHFKQAYIKFRFVPYLIYFLLIIFYTTLTHEFETTDNLPGSDLR